VTLVVDYLVLCPTLKHFYTLQITPVGQENNPQKKEWE